MERLLQGVLAKIIRKGTLRIMTATGRCFTLGDNTGKPLALRFTSPSAELGILLDPELKFGEAFTDGTLIVEQGTIADVLALVMEQTRAFKAPPWAQPQWLIRYLHRRWAQFNLPSRARQNVAHHYDLDGRLYSIFLDADRQYSCAYFENDDQTLDDAQLAKKRHIAAKLLVQPGHSVLDIGSGWGGLALYLAEMCGAHVRGVTLSDEQLALSRGRAAEKGLARQVEFALADYRQTTGTFDRLVSVGMFEHVGLGFY